MIMLLLFVYVLVVVVGGCWFVLGCLFVYAFVVVVGESGLLVGSGAWWDTVRPSPPNLQLLHLNPSFTNVTGVIMNRLSWEIWETTWRRNNSGQCQVNQPAKQFLCWIFYKAEKKTNVTKVKIKKKQEEPHEEKALWLLHLCCSNFCRRRLCINRAIIHRLLSGSCHLVTRVDHLELEGRWTETKSCRSPEKYICWFIKITIILTFTCLISISRMSGILRIFPGTLKLNKDLYERV